MSSPDLTSSSFRPQILLPSSQWQSLCTLIIVVAALYGNYVCLTSIPLTPLRAERLEWSKVFIIHLCRVPWGDVAKRFQGPTPWVSRSGVGLWNLHLKDWQDSQALGLLWDTALELCIVFGTKYSINSLLTGFYWPELWGEMVTPRPPFLCHITTVMAIPVLFPPKPKGHVPCTTSLHPPNSYFLSLFNHNSGSRAPAALGLLLRTHGNI